MTQQLHGSAVVEGFRGTFTIGQTKQLLAPIKHERVLSDPRGNSHVSQQDVTAHLIRVFGFGNFATEILDLQCIFETVRENSKTGTFKDKGVDHKKADNPHVWRYDVAYRCTFRVSIFDEHHNFVTAYEDASVGDAQNQNRQDAHDLAMKSAISVAKKRCCINLGDQFGLSLYNKGQESALVRGTHILPATDEPDPSMPKLDEVRDALLRPGAVRGIDDIATRGLAVVIDEHERVALARERGHVLR